ncbi:MAG: hypothetical protein ACRECI_06505 [Methyloceanibacter sp.]|jgi:hypothetical protein
MFRLADRFLVPCCAILLPLAAHTSPQLAVYLRNYYTEYQVIKECVARDHLQAADVVTAKTAITKIETYYLRRDSSINKASLLKQAVKNKNAAFKMMSGTNKIDPREFCLGSLHDLLGKSNDIVADTAPEKSGS